MTVPPPAASVIPENAPFSPEQRAWLNGFFAGLLSLDAAPQAAAAPAGVGNGGPDEAPWHDPALPLEERMKLAEGKPLARRMMAAMAQQDCGQCGYVCETYAKAIAEQAEPRLNLCVPGGKATARALKTLVEEMGGGVLDPGEKAAKEAVPGRTRKPADTRPGCSREAPAQAVFLSRRRLNREGSEKETWHIEIALGEDGPAYAPGDSLGVFPKNDPALVDAILAAIGAPHDFPIAGKVLRQTLIEDMALSPAPDALFHLISYLTGGERRRKAQALAKGEDPDGDAATLDVLAAFEKFPGLRPDPEAFVESLEPLQPRLYSISSSPKAAPGRVSLTADAVRYEAGGRKRCGVASVWLAERLVPGSAIPVYVQKPHGFSLPEDGATPIVMVGPGTGIAPFRAFLQHRRATGASGPAWLFFGHRRRTCDFFYEDEIEEFRRAGVLTRLSLAWSRDGAEKVYVQDRIREEGAELLQWLERGAHFYVCGDAARMAKDVEAAVCGLFAVHGKMTPEDAKAQMAALKQAGRYQTDVY